MASNPIPRPDNISPAPQVPDPDRPIREVQLVCAQHAVPCNTPESLAQFMRALQADKHFAMDFWSLVARLSGRSHSAAPDWLLTTIVEGVTGQSLADVKTAGPSQRVLVDKLSGMLGGEDETAAPPRPVQSSPVPDDVPHDYAPSRGAVPPLFTPDSFSDRTGGPRLVLRPETPIAAAMDRSQHEHESEHQHEPTRPQQETEPSISIPLAAYAEDNADATPVSRRLVGGLVLIVLAVAGLLALRYLNPSGWQRLGTAARAQYASAVAVFHRHPAAPPAPSAKPSGNPDQASLIVYPSQPAVAAPTNSPPPAAAAPNPEPAALESTEPTAAKTSNSSESESDTARSQETQPHTEAQVAVPASSMRENLISSRIPIYPKGASGTVVIQAIVTARGTVEPVRVVSGDPALRQAAMAAVATWHYRPYLLNGTPVDVSTTISVSDSGND